jgi:steroid delta-isomerase-like uncharacterized protein
MAVVERLETETEQGASRMNAEINKATVERMLEKFNRNELDTFEECVGPSFVLHSTLLTDPKGGPGDVQSLFSLVRQGFPDAKITVQQIAAQGDVVAVRFLFTGTHLGEMRGNEPTGRSISWQESMFCRCDDGKVQEVWHILNVMEVLEKLGVLPPERVRARIAQVLRAFRKLGKLIPVGRG